MHAKQQVLLVDDEPEILVALEDLLSDQFSVLTARTGADALRIMSQRDEIAVVITDQRMPQMQGDELVAQVQEFHLAQRILVTGYADLAAVVRAVNEGQIFAYVTKPWNGDDLKMKVNKAAEQFRLSRELAAEKRLLDDLMNNSPDGIFFKDHELRFIRANKTIAGWLGEDVHSLVGKRLSDVMMAPLEVDRIEEEEKRSLRSNEAILDCVREQRMKNAVRWFSETKAPVHGLEDSQVGLIGICRDITRQRELEQQLLQSQKMEAMGKLAGGVAHDFNNLLMVMQAYGEMLRDGVVEEKVRRDHAEQLLRAVDRAAGLTKQLLTFSRKGPARSILVNVNDVITDVVHMLRRLVPQDIDLNAVLMTDEELVRADPTRLEQVIVNLVINARDAMPKGGHISIKTEAFTSSSEEADEPCRCVRISVSDDGLGMPREVKERIFEPFFTTKEVGKGTGLGLSTVYGIVRQLGGQINVESEVGSGTTFLVDIPCAAREPSSAPVRRMSVRPSDGSETVLLVEDDEDVRRITGRILQSHGFTVLSAETPEKAQEICKKHHGEIDVLLTDVSMPQMDGITLAERLTEMRPRLCVIYMSGYVAEDVNGQVLSKQECNYIEKPFGPEQLLTVIRLALAAG